jgi:hypothetical protein
MYGLTSDLVNAALADRQREAGRVALENTVAVHPAVEGRGLRRLTSALTGAVTAVRRGERKPQARPVAAG